VELRKFLVGAALAALVAPGAEAAPTYIHAGKLIDVPGQQVKGASTIIVDNGRVIAVRDGFVVPTESGAAVVDLKGKTVLPGLIDSHVHLVSDRGGEQALLADIRDDDPHHAYEAQLNGMKTLGAGFTTLRNIGDDKGVTMALRDAIKRGWVQGPRIIDAAQSISTTGGHMDGRGALNDELVAHLPDPENLCDSVESCRRVVRRQIDRGAEDTIGILGVIKTSVKRWGVGMHRRGYITFLEGFLGQMGVKVRQLSAEEASDLGLRQLDNPE
jgi:imidazolonepropionase-like amidohydrolase